MMYRSPARWLTLLAAVLLALLSVPEFSAAMDADTAPAMENAPFGWLLPVDTDTPEEADKTDMSGAINAMLDTLGYCHLAPGIYYVREGIRMPAGATLEGCGWNTVIRLMADVEEGCCVRLSKNNTVNNLRFSGAARRTMTPSDTLTGRNGLMLAEPATDRVGYTETNMVSQCYFQDFSGSAVYLSNVGGGIETGSVFSGCKMEYCGAGIYLDYLAEYNKFDDIVIFRCYYACVTLGGNNVFTGCSFHGAVGMLLDNSSQQYSNNGHGSAIGCTFNHTGNWLNGSRGHGDAIRFIGARNGFLFDGCQFWYSRISLKDSRGVTFSGCLFGLATIDAEDHPLLMHGCTFVNVGSIMVPVRSRLTDCYTNYGENVMDLVDFRK